MISQFAPLLLAAICEVPSQESLERGRADGDGLSPRERGVERKWARHPVVTGPKHNLSEFGE